jgi:aldose 1-epimerase
VFAGDQKVLRNHTAAAVGLLLAAGLSGCNARERAVDNTSIDVKPFGETSDGSEVSLFTLANATGIELSITDYGGIVTRLLVPDRDGELADVVLGFDSLHQYLAGTPYFGAIVGRYGNRIAGGRFVLDDELFVLATNDGANHLHGGLVGFDKVVWDAETFANGDTIGVQLSRVSPDGEEGYPGALHAQVTYSLTNANELIIEYAATTDRPTVVNLTHHSYFNLAGHSSGDILEHELMLLADRFTPVGAGLIPTGEVRAVEGTPMDFGVPTAIGDRIDQADEQLDLAGGYDHNWVLEEFDGSLRLAARVVDPASGRAMEVHTTEPGLQFYSGNFLDGTIVGKGGTRYDQRSGFCLETQHFPDSPNHPEFPSTVLRPGDHYRSTTIFKFTTR